MASPRGGPPSICSEGPSLAAGAHSAPLQKNIFHGHWFVLLVGGAFQPREPQPTPNHHLRHSLAFSYPHRFPVPPKAEDFNAKTPSKAEGAKPLRLPFFLCAFALFQALEKSARNFLWRASRHPRPGKNAACTFQSLEILSARIARRYSTGQREFPRLLKTEVGQMRLSGERTRPRVQREAPSPHAPCTKQFLLADREGAVCHTRGRVYSPVAKSNPNFGFQEAWVLRQEWGGAVC